MRHRILTTFVLITLFVPGFSQAVDYNDWRPLLPNKLDGLEVTPDGGGANIKLGEMDMSDLELIYGIGERQIRLKVTYESTGEGLEHFRLATQGDLVMPGYVSKKVVIQGFDCLYQYEESDNSVFIVVILKDTAVLAFSTSGENNEKHYVSVVNTLKLKEINATI